MGEILFLSILGVVDVIMFFLTFTFPASIIDQSGGAGLFPRIVLVLLLVFLAVRIITILRSEEEKKKPFAFLEIFKGRRLVFLLAFVLYAFSMSTLGFVISSGIFLSAMIIFLRWCQYGEWMPVKKSVLTVLISFVCVFVIYYVFTHYLNVMLPAGFLDI